MWWVENKLIAKFRSDHSCIIIYTVAVSLFYYMPHVHDNRPNSDGLIKVLLLMFKDSLMATLKPYSNGPLYSNTAIGIGTMAVDGWAGTFGTARRGLGGLWRCPVPSSLYQM